MADTPDLSQVVSLIMQNPALIEQISSLVKSNNTVDQVVESKVEEAETAEEIEAEEVSAVPIMRSHRHELLNAMKPYLSEKRRVAIDSMSSILDVIDVMVKK